MVQVQVFAVAPGSKVSILDGEGKVVVRIARIEEVIIPQGNVVRYRVSFWIDGKMDALVVDSSEISEKDQDTIKVGFHQ